MSSESIPPPVPGSSGGGIKYAVIGVVLLGATAGLWFAMSGGSEPSRSDQPPASADAGASLSRSQVLANDDLVIPDPTPDAGPVVAQPVPPDAGPARAGSTRPGGGGGGSWDCAGTVPAAAARTELAQRSREFRACYERRLKSNNLLEGRVNLQMRVGRGGEVSAVRTGGTMSDGEVLSCVRGIAQRIRFPAPTGGTCAVVAAPFNFTPRQ